MADFHRTELAAWALRAWPGWVWIGLQYATLVLEIGAPLWFTLRRTRAWALLAGFALHLGIALLMRNVGVFSLQMIGFYPVFISAVAPQAIVATLSARMQSSMPTRPKAKDQDVTSSYRKKGSKK